MRRKPRRKGDWLIEFLMDRVVIFFGFIFCLGGVAGSGGRVRRVFQRRISPAGFFSPAKDTLKRRMT